MTSFMLRRLHVPSLAVLLLTMAALPIRAQVTAAISGTIEDASGAPVSGATVTVTSLETGATRTATTDEGGNYLVPALPLGLQQVKIEKPSFKTVVRTGINLEVGQNAVVSVRMEVGELAQAVTILADASLVNTTTSAVSGMVGSESVKELPLNGRSFDNLITLNASAVNYTAMKSSNTTTSDGNGFSVDGQRPGDNLFLWNGVEYTSASQLAVTPGGVSGQLLGIDAIREVNVLTDTYGAEYGKRDGAQVVVVTQTGTNSLHGTLFEFLRNSDLDGAGIFNNGTTPALHRNQFGAALGGPLKKDRLFLFGNYEGFRESTTVNTLSVVPDAQARLGMLPNASTGVYAPVSGLNPGMLPFTAFWPQPGPELMVNGAACPAPAKPCLPSGTADSYNGPVETIHENFGTARGEYVPRDNTDRVSVSYLIDTGDSIVPLADPLFASGLQLGAQVASIEETHVFSPTILNTARVGFSRGAFNYNAASYFTFPPSLAFVAGGQPGAITVNGGITAAGGNVNAGVFDRRNLFTYTDDFQVLKGIHQISAGVWIQRVQENEDTASRRLGMATFTSLTTFLQGTVASLQVVPDHNELGWRSVFGAWYIQDSMKLRHNLTFQAGLRQEFTNGWNEQSGRASNYVAGPNGVLLTAPVVGDAVFPQNNATHLFGPRVGLAWDPFGNQKIAIRAGFGTYYSLIDVLSFLLNSLPPYNGSVTFKGSILPLLPITPNVPIPPSCGPGVVSGCSIYAPQGVQANAKTPTVEEWNFSVEQQLSRNMALRLSYVGSHGYHGMLSLDPNTVPAQVCQSAGGCLAGGINNSNGGGTLNSTATVPQGTTYIPIQTVPAGCATTVCSGRPNPYLSAGFFWYTEGNSSYNALQADFRRRLSAGLQFRANYTWSKNLDMNSGLTVAQANNQPQIVYNRNDLPLDWGPAAIDVKSQASISLTYDLPFFRSAAKLPLRLFQGWQLNGIVTLLTGFPFTPVIGSDISGDGNTRNSDRPNLNPSFSGPVIEGKQSQWFNPSAFTMPLAGTFGSLGRGVFTGPGLEEFDVSLFKNTSLSERLKLQFRAEFFNLLNHVNLGTPNATVFSGGAISGSAGQITTLATTPRQIQFGLKLIF